MSNVKAVSNVIAIPRIEKCIDTFIYDMVEPAKAEKRLKMILSLSAVPLDHISRTENELTWLSDEQLETLCEGDEEAQAKIVVSPETRGFLAWLWEQV